MRREPGGLQRIAPLVEVRRHVLKVFRDEMRKHESIVQRVPHRTRLCA